jgi:hypothetical protein
VLEVADIVRAAGAAYREAHGTRLLPSHRRVLDDIATCRTAARGGHVYRCDHCAALRYSYHSCRNRHCPKCAGDRTRRWLEAERRRLLACPHFLVTFTLPEELRALARSHQKRVYGAMMRAAAEALLTLAADPEFLGARPGLLAVLHTWTQALLYHPHVHVLVTAGGLANDRTAWVRPRHDGFLGPGYVLAVLFRATLRDALRRTGLLADAPRNVWNRRWVVHIQHAGSGEKVLEYLARYLFRVAIANSRLESFEHGLVTWRYRDRTTGRTKRCTLPAPQFLGRFLQHVLPRGFAKVRHAGLYSPRSRHDLMRDTALLQATSAPPPTLVTPELAARHDDTTTPVDPDENRCPVCGLGRLHRVGTLQPARPPP